MFFKIAEKPFQPVEDPTSSMAHDDDGSIIIVRTTHNNKWIVAAHDYPIPIAALNGFGNPRESYLGPVDLARN